MRPGYVSASVDVQHPTPRHRAAAFVFRPNAGASRLRASTDRAPPLLLLVTRPRPQARREASLPKVKLIRALQDDAIRRRREKVYDATSMAVTARLLEINPEVLTAWNFRREAIVFAGCAPERRRTNNLERTRSFAPTLADELALTERCLRKHPKSYPAWHHRKWCVARRVYVPRGDVSTRTETDAENAETESHTQRATGFADARGFPVASLLATELAMAQALLDLDDRNFHGWGYRRFVTFALANANDGARESTRETPETPERRRKPEASSPTRDHDRDRATSEASEASEASARAELRYSEAKIERNFSNYSAWHHRAANLPRAYAGYAGPGPTDGVGASRDGGVPADVLANEYAFVRQAFFTEPEDQAGWMYHRWLTAQTKNANANEAFAAPGEAAAAAAAAADDAKRAVFAGEADALRELCALEPDCKWPALTLARLCDLQGTEAGAAESAARFAELARLDPARRGFYCDCCRV